LLVVVALAAGIGLARYGDSVPWLADLTGQPTKTTETVVLGVRRLNELATAEMVAQVVVTEAENTRILTQPLPEFLTGETVLLVAVGEVEAGIDLDELGEDDVRVENGKVTVELPQARILDSSLDEDKTRLYDRDRGLLRIRGNDALLEEARRDAEDEMVKAAQEQDLVAKAQDNAEEGIRGFLGSLGYAEVEFN
jgi:hypothetical protein